MDHVTTIDEELRSRAAQVLAEAANWRRSSAYWDAITVEVDNVALALQKDDGPGLRRAVEEIELLGPNRIGDPGNDGPAPLALVARIRSLVLAFSPTDR